MQGKVRWFNNKKGYGFIELEDGQKDVFAHFSEVTMEGFKTLSAGQQVKFDLVEGPKGPHASNIELL